MENQLMKMAEEFSRNDSFAWITTLFGSVKIPRSVSRRQVESSEEVWVMLFGFPWGQSYRKCL